MTTGNSEGQGSKGPPSVREVMSRLSWRRGGRYRYFWLALYGWGAVFNFVDLIREPHPLWYVGYFHLVILVVATMWAIETAIEIAGEVRRSYTIDLGSLRPRGNPVGGYTSGGNTSSFTVYPSTVTINTQPPPPPPPPGPPDHRPVG